MSLNTLARGVLCCGLLLLLASSGVQAQTNAQPSTPTDGGGEDEASQSFYRVYQYDTPLAGWSEPTLWTTYIPRSRSGYNHFGKSLEREGLTAYSLEWEYGATDHASIAAYLDFEDPHNAPLRFTRGRIEARYRFHQRYEHFFNTAVYAEYYLPRKSYSRSQELETRVILDHDFNDFRVALNPILSIETTGNPDKRVNPSFAGGVYYRRRYLAQPGLEIYDDFRNKQHVIFPTLDLRVGGLWWHVGMGLGLTHASDNLTFKSILTYEFNSIRPTRLFK